MGKDMSIKNPGHVLDGLSRDGREFGHVTENLRDALLNGAKSVEFRIQGLAIDKPCVARRAIADDGDGMSEATLLDVYHDFSVTGTSRDFNVTLDDDGNVHVDTEPVIITDPAHERRGVGGRASLLGWNPFGVVTVTIHKGVARMTHMFKTLSGKPQMREWFNEETGARESITTPYIEPELLTRGDLLADRDFTRVLLVRSGVVSTPEEADRLVHTLSEDGGIDNPMRGTEWDGEVIPKWIMEDFGDDDLAYRADGSLAHGTVKVLLGQGPTDSTALTGDPAFPNEATYSKYNGAGNQFWLDLTNQEVRITTMTTKPRADTRVWYDIIGKDKHRFESGSLSTNKPSGRLQVGSYGVRVNPTSDNPKPIVGRWVLDLGKFGRALLLFQDDRSRSSDTMWGTTRKGVIGVVYGNEIHSLGSDSVETSSFAFTNMGIPVVGNAKDRVSVFLFLPRATDTVEGVFQASARDRLKWTGRSDSLPIAEINQAVVNELPESFLALVSGGTDDDTVDYDKAEIKRAFKSSKTMTETGRESMTPKVKRGAAAPDENPALLDDDHVGDEKSGTEIGRQGTPGDTERPVCPLCGQKIHAVDCPNKPEGSGGAGGGTKGVVRALSPEEKGKRTGRVSRAHRVSSAPTPVTEPEMERVLPNPPKITFVKADELPRDHDHYLPVIYTQPHTLLPDTGIMVVNRDHATVERIFGIARSYRRSATFTEKATEDWIRTKLTDVVFGMLSLDGQEHDSMDREKFLLKKAAARMAANQELWLGVLASLFLQERSLKGAFGRVPAGKRAA